MPRFVGIRLGTRRATGLAPQWMDWLQDPEADAGKGPGLTGTVMRQQFLQAANVAVVRAVRILRTVRKPGSKRIPGC
jgi:hypothetical protein